MIQPYRKNWECDIVITGCGKGGEDIITGYYACVLIVGCTYLRYYRRIYALEENNIGGNDD